METLEVVPVRKNSDPRIYNSNISIGVQAESPKVSHNAFRRASAVLSKLLPSADTQKEGKSKESEEPPDEGLGKLLSATYCQTLVLMGLVLPLTEVLVEEVSPKIYQGFYIFLCSGSLVYLCWMYATLVKDRTVVNIINSYRGDEAAYNAVKRRFRGPINRYGSFYLRLGAVAFGIGSMVYSGLEFGQILEVEDNPDCHNFAQAIIPAFRMILTIAQMQFIFLNSRNMDLCQKPTISRFGLMHMIGTNLCEWLNVIIQETKHEIAHVKGHTHETHASNHSASGNSTDLCHRTNIMGSLVQNVSPFLFPCTIEYSLICAVIMLEMWKDVKTPPKNQLVLHRSSATKAESKPSQLFTVDCANAHKGLFCGVVFLVLTIICLIIYFVFSAHTGYETASLLVINSCELVLFMVSFLAVCLAALRLRGAIIVRQRPSMCLDTWLLLMGQVGVSLYGTFRVIGLMVINEWIWNDVARLIQSSTQSVFVVHAWRLKSRNINRPARQLITFLLTANMGIWSVNTLVRNRASSDQLLLPLFGPWAWTTVTRLAMPLAIFYRFHSTICLFEIWKNTYKPSSKPYCLRQRVA